ncbi:MAG: sulfite exporter TauE/SafE family protein [Planctomycetota bacterium]
MIELPLIFVSGLLGASHCVGMCGPFAALLGSAARDWRQNAQWQLLYSVGRVFTYTLLGAMAGYGGQRLVGLKWFGINVTALLAIGAGLFLIYEGLATAGFIRRYGAASTTLCPTAGLLRSMLRRRDSMGVFLAGIATGFLPCGLVYAFLLTAARTSQPLLGAAIMATFGLGTVPWMAAAGSAATLVPVTARMRLFRLAGWCVVLVGALSLYRGYQFLTVTDPEACPFCVMTSTEPSNAPRIGEAARVGPAPIGWQSQSPAP